MTEAGLRLCRSWPQRLADMQFSPAGFTAIPREAKLRVRCHPPLALRGFACGRGSSGHVPSHRGRDGHGLEDQDRRFIMATIGTFKKTANNEFIGEIVTLSVQAKGVSIVPEEIGRASGREQWCQ